ncbi:MAG: hypothetical protein DWP92_01670 [Armatimonadetes bacterium]|nr:MAG: hypothetical protein DWP92_01670 [Armatimonadota bacterium]
MTIPAPADDEKRRHTAALLVAARLYQRKQSPHGIAGGFEAGPVRLSFKDPDVVATLSGLRRAGADLDNQTWPVLAEFRTWIDQPTSGDDGELTAILDSAIDVVRRYCSGFGVA